MSFVVTPFSEISGETFNTIYNGTKFYKILRTDLTHNNFRYCMGLNIDTVPFSPRFACQKGGLYFCEESKAHLYVFHHGDNLARVSVPDDARVYVEEDKFKADKLIIEEITQLEHVPDTFWINALRYDGMILRYVRHQTEDICKIAVQEDGNALQYVHCQTEELCRLAVTRTGLAISFIKDPALLTPEVCRMAIEQTPYALEHIDKQFQSYELCVSAVKRCPRTLRFMKLSPQPYDLCKLAVEQDGQCLVYVDADNRTEELSMMAVKDCGLLLKYVINQTEEICKTAIQQNGAALQFVANQTEELCRLAVIKNCYAIQYVKESLLTDDICRLAVDHDLFFLETIKRSCDFPCTLITKIERSMECSGVWYTKRKNPYAW